LDLIKTQIKLIVEDCYPEFLIKILITLNNDFLIETVSKIMADSKIFTTHICAKILQSKSGRGIRGLAV
tara:strand:- start:214 stop:420 length:207 start_codon:yes stop_codon:yes gene_type:complete